MLGNVLYIKWVVLYLGIHSHQKKMIMSNLQVSKYLLGIIVSSVGMLIHLFQMIETSEMIHLVCFLLWSVILFCFYYILGKKLQRF